MIGISLFSQLRTSCWYISIVQPDNASKVLVSILKSHLQQSIPMADVELVCTISYSKAIFSGTRKQSTSIVTQSKSDTGCPTRFSASSTMKLL